MGGKRTLGFKGHTPRTMRPVSTNAGQLCGQLAAAMARAFHGDQRDLAKMWVPDYDIHDFGELADALQDIGLVKPRLFFAMLPDEMPNFLDGKLAADDPRVARVINAFIRCACGYELRPGAKLQWGDWKNYPHDFVSDWFEVRGLYRNAMEYLVAAGFAEQLGNSFRWTEKVSFTMHP